MTTIKTFAIGEATSAIDRMEDELGDAWPTDRPWPVAIDAKARIARQALNEIRIIIEKELNS